MSYAAFHEEIARLIKGIEALDMAGEDDVMLPYLQGPIPIHLEKTHVGDLVMIDAGMWNYEEVKA